MTVPFVVETPTATVEGDLTVPSGATGVIVFAHGSGSSRRSPRNQAVAEALQHNGFATLLLDMLSADEERAEAAGRRRRFDIDLLRERLVRTLDELRRHPPTRTLPHGLFGASTGAAAALTVAAARPDVRAVVSRGGRPDLAGTALQRVTAPVLLIVGERDEEVIRLNEEAAGKLRGHRELLVIPGAGHLFPEPGALEQVADAAVTWFSRYLGQS
jgi:pimeloyl-ACP methyl ester carboxylesterase